MLHKLIAFDDARIKMEGEGRIIEGYASKFGGVDAYGDTVMPGAYAKTLQNRSRPVRMRWNHYGPVIGKWLEIREDNNGLYVKGELTEGHSVADDAYASLRHGAVDGMSIGYREKAGEDSPNGGRILKEIELIEISVVEEPADLGAKIEAVKHLSEAITECESLKQVESLLREAGGFSRANATALVSRIKRLSLGEQEQTSQRLAHVKQIQNLLFNLRKEA